MKRAFTLIELLIVVAIIAILAAIAVPNFLEAQTRSKVARTVADMRTIATAIEAYTVDNNKAPLDFAPDVAFPYYLHNGISTPIAYLSSGHLIFDQFAKERVSVDSNRIRERYRYRAFAEIYLTSEVTTRPGNWSLPGPTAPGNQKALQVFGAWFLVSKGTDALQGPLPQGFSDGNSTNDWLWQIYDPSNGTISWGDIIRSQAQPEVNGYDLNVTYNVTGFQ